MKGEDGLSIAVLLEVNIGESFADTEDSLDFFFSLAIDALQGEG